MIFQLVQVQPWESVRFLNRKNSGFLHEYTILRAWCHGKIKLWKWRICPVFRTEPFFVTDGCLTIRNNRSIYSIENDYQTYYSVFFLSFTTMSVPLHARSPFFVSGTDVDSTKTWARYHIITIDRRFSLSKRKTHLRGAYDRLLFNVRHWPLRIYYVTFMSCPAHANKE